MRGRWGDALSFASVAMMLSGIGYASGHSQVVMEETFSMETSACDGMSCRKEIIGANEALGVGAVAACSQSTNYWKGDLEYAPAGHTELFELWYSCRKVSLLGESAMLMSWEECGMVAEPCLDIGFDPDTFEVTYQVSFDFTSMAAYDVSVDVKVYMSYLQVDDDFYTLRSKDPTRCDLRETCHRSCETGESGFIAELEDSMGDGWNAGGINHFDHFRLESQSELAAVVAADMTPSTNDTNGTAGTAAAAAAAAARRTSYKNTMLGGSSRKVPVCLSDGEYLFSTEFQVPTPDPLATYGTYSAPDSVFSVGGRQFSESSWTFCGYTGMLSDYTHVRVSGGVCVATDGWGQAAAPSATPVVGVEEAPTPAPTPTITIAGSPTSSPTAPPADGTDDAFAEDDDDEVVSDEGGQDVDGGGEGDGNDGGSGGGDRNDSGVDGGGGDGDVDGDVDGDGDGDGGSDGDGGGDGDGDGNETQDIASDDSGKSTLTKLEIWGIGLGAAGLAGLAAAGGTYAQNKGWFAPAGAGGGAAAGGGGGGAPNPDVDEFAP